MLGGDDRLGGVRRVGAGQAFDLDEGSWVMTTPRRSRLEGSGIARVARSAAFRVGPVGLDPAP
jgi:hypothetical protein